MKNPIPNNTGPTPPHIVTAIQEIAAYLRENGLEQAVISHTGGTSFLLKNVFQAINKSQTKAGKTKK